MKNKTSEARLKANKKYLSQFKDVKIRLKPNEHEELQEHAKNTGESVAAFIRRAIAETIKKDNTSM
ncbi:MAG: plasmid mobilization protein [Ruminococcus sp.]